MRISIKTGNAAFDGAIGGGGGFQLPRDPSVEVSRILRKLADRLDSTGMPVPGDPIILMDSNGNRVGKAEGH